MAPERIKPHANSWFAIGAAKIKIRRAFTIDLTQAQVAHAATAQCQSFVHLSVAPCVERF